MAEGVHLVEARSERRRCPLCFEPLPSSPDERACESCGTAYHAACFAELGGCGTSGCARATSARVRVRVAARAAAPGAAASSDLPALVCAMLAALGTLAAGGVACLWLARLMPEVGLLSVVAVLLLSAIAAKETERAAAPPRTGKAAVIVSLVCGLVGGAAAAAVAFGLGLAVMAEPMLAGVTAFVVGAVAFAVTARLASS